MAKFKCNMCGQTFEADTMPDKCPICGADKEFIEEVVEAGAQPAAPKKKKGIDTNSNVYTIVYAAVMVVIVAFLLAFVTLALKDTQDANVANDTKGQILTALGYDKATVDIAKTFESVQDNLWKNGQLVPVDAKDFKSTYGGEIKAGNLHVFVAKMQDGTPAYVLPVTGRGLWGGLWGYIAIDETKTKVLGTYFYHESETAGLGARIGERDFQERFIGKPIFGTDGNVALTVVKSGQAKAEYEVDGITGATLTSKGVAAMVNDGLKLYVEAGFLGAAPAACDKACDEACAEKCPCGEECKCDPCQCAEKKCECGECKCDPCQCGEKKCECGECKCDPCQCAEKCQCGEDCQCGQEPCQCKKDANVEQAN